MAKTPSYEKIELEQSPELTVKVQAEDLAADPSVVEPTTVGKAAVSQPTVGQSTLGKVAVGQPGNQVIAERYQVLNKLGSGGMSTVYRVKHLHLDKILALKLLHQVSENSMQRFQLEAKAATLLEHPNIIRVQDFGITAGQPYMTMDCIEGDSLADVLKKDGPLSLDRMLRLFGQICNALAHAHEQGVVHRDLKPSNIIVKPSDNAGEQAIVVDFGIAKILDETETVEKANLTKTGDIFGTPLYMSPEQSQGHKVDARSDIYSLACVMYESIVGKPPFQGDSVYHIIHKQITESPPAFPDHLRKTSAGRRLEALILKALAKEPADRHKYMLELSSELKSIENNDAGFLGELKSLSAIFNRRLRATERRNVLAKVALHCFTVFACVLSAAILCLPPQINLAQVELKRDDQIVNKVHQMFDFNSRANAVFYTRPLVPMLLDLKLLCIKGDKVQKKTFRDFSRSLTHTMDESLHRMNDIQRTLVLKSYDGLTKGEFSALQNTFGTVITSWSDTNSKGNRLTDYTQSRMIKTRQNLSLMELVLSLSIIAAPICEIIIGYLVLNMWIRKRRALLDENDNSAEHR